MKEERPVDQPLPEPVRDHIGQQLRAVYTVDDGQPQFLGDTVPEVPEEFAPQIERLEKRLKTHEEGTEAVGQALDKILDAFGVLGTDVGPGASGQRSAAPNRSEGEPTP